MFPARTSSIALVALATSVILVSGPSVAFAAQPKVDLGTATPFAVLAGTTVTNTGPSVISGDLGVSPGSAVTGFPPGQVINGAQHVADAVALQAQNDLTTAYNDAAGRTPVVDETGKDLGGQTLVAGVYKSTSGLSLTGTLTLDAKGDPDAVFIFQAGSTLITASSSTVALAGGAQACNVFWQVASSATLGTTSTFVGSVMALTDASLQTGATVQGRVLARNGQVSLDSNTITQTACSSATPTATPTPTPTPTPTSTPTATETAKPTSGGGGAGGGPTIPAGHPATGLAPTGGEPASDNWLVLALLALGGAATATVMGTRSSQAPDRRQR